MKLVTRKFPITQLVLCLLILLYFVIIGIQTNIPFHQAVMENPRFIKGEIGTHFIDSEVDLIEGMKKIAEQNRQLRDKMIHLSEDKKRIAAIAVAAAMTHMREQV